MEQTPRVSHEKVNIAMPRPQRDDLTPKPINWKTNLAALWVSQFLTLSGFYFSLPFISLYLRDNKIVPEADVAYWSGVFISAAPVCMMIFAPIWGMVGDRYGRKMMLVRATLCGGFILYLMGVVESIEALIVLRMMQGAFTGTIPAAQSLAAAGTPSRNQGLAQGLLMAAVTAALTAGSYLGGICAKHFGVATSYRIGSMMLFVATFLVVAFVRENFVPPPRPARDTASVRMRHRRESIVNFKSGLPVLAGICFVSVLQTYDGPFLALYIDELFRASPAAAGLTEQAVSAEIFGVTGGINALVSIAAFAGSIGVGMIMDRKMTLLIWPFLAIVGGAGIAWIVADPTIFGLGAGRSLFFFVQSGLAAVMVALMSRLTPHSRKGAALGWSMTARSVGWAAAPMAAALLANRYGSQAAWVVLAVVAALLAPYLLYLTRRYAQAFRPEDDDPPIIEAVEESNLVPPGGAGTGNSA
jgi:DHA1 family multidrug resistance protein-like MFS transporter